ncbi:hypothetical protein ACR780_07340 [Sphingobacterium faecium]|uniref:hypothetical protein n=1 Tax=Sphingobacterium faecium TaxID=34087 RepID=UPI003DA49D97
MARSAVDKLTTAFLGYDTSGLSAAIVKVDTAIKAAANVFAKVFIMSLCYTVSFILFVDSKVGCKSSLPYDN